MKILTFMILLLPLYFSKLNARVIVISDIDDTIKQSNSASHSAADQAYHFYLMKSYPVMAALYQDLLSFYKNDDITFYYVSAAYDFLYEQEEWLDRYGFPYGENFLRQTLSERTYDHKYETMSRLLANLSDDDLVLFFGDNSSHDPQVYLDIIRDLKISEAKIYIRDVTMRAHAIAGMTPQRLSGIFYFISEVELLSELAQELFLSASTVDYMKELFSRKLLIPLYTHKTLVKLLDQNRRCYSYVRTLSSDCPAADRFFENYYAQVL